MRDVLRIDDAIETYADQWSELCDEMYWEGGLNYGLAFRCLEAWARRDGYTLLAQGSDEDTVYQAYINTEKGLS